MNQTRTVEQERAIERNRHNFVYHAPNERKVEAHAYIRCRLQLIADDLVDHCPQGRELSIALTKLEEAMFWANAAIARGDLD